MISLLQALLKKFFYVGKNKNLHINIKKLQKPVTREWVTPNF